MKLSEIRLVDYRNHKDTAVTLGHVNVFFGPNGSGKSSLLSAVETVLIGRNEWAETEGGLQVCIKDGAKRAEVTITGRNPVTKVIRSARTELKVGSTVITQERLLESMNVSEPVVRALCRTGKFLQMTEEEQQDLLFGLIGLQIDAPSLFARIQEWAKLVNVELDVQAMLAGIEEPMESKSLNAMIASLNAVAVKQRRHVGREVDRLKKLIEASEKELRGAEALKWSPEKQAEAERLAGERDNLMQRMGRQKSQTQVLEETKRMIERVTKEIAFTKKQLEKPAGKSEDTLREEVAEMTQSLKEFTEQQAVLEQDIAKLMKDYEQFKPSIKEGRVQTPANFECPIYALRCPVDTGIREKSISKRKDKVAQMVREMGAKKAELDTLKFHREKTMEECATLKHQLLNANNNDRQVQEPRLKQLETDLAEAVTRQQTALNETKAAEDISPHLAEIDAQIAKIRSQKGQADAITKSEAVLQTFRDQLKTNETWHAGWDTLAKATETDGVKAAMLREAIGPIERRVNERMLMLTGGQWGCFLLAEGRYHPRLVRIEGGVQRPPAAMSHSEQKLVAVAMQDALAHLSGLRLLMIDEAELFDTTLRRYLVEFLTRVKDDYDTVFLGLQHPVGEAADAEVQEFERIPGTVLHRVEDGHVETVTRGTADFPMAAASNG